MIQYNYDNKRISQKVEDKRYMKPITIRFKQFGQKKYEARMSRVFSPRVAEKDLIKAVNSCLEMCDVEEIAERNDLCDYCSLVDLNIDAAKLLINTVIKLEYRYPKTRCRICYLGSRTGFVVALSRIQKLDRQVIEKFGIQNICYDMTYTDLSTLGLKLIQETKYDDKDNNILAQACSLSGMLDGIILDEQDFRGFGYWRLCSKLKLNEQSGYHPRGCGTPDYVIYHELGHIIDNVCGLSGKRDFINYYNSLSQSQIEKGVSKYATTNAQEFIAEAFAEYMCAPSPRPIALSLSELLNKIYKNLGGFKL